MSTGERGERGIQGPLGGQGIEGERGPQGVEGAEGPMGAGGGIGKRGERGPRGGIPTSIAVIYLITTLVVTAVFIFGAWQTLENRELARDGDEAHDALCVLKLDLERRVGTSRQFLKDNPQGIPGIPPQVIRNGIRNQQATIDSLDKLDCQPPPEGATP